MNTARVANPGKTRACPHCKSTILESAAICPGCQHHLKFGSAAAARPVLAMQPLRFEGTIVHPPSGDPWEYSVVLSIRNGRGEEVKRQVVGVGALLPSESRAFTLAVEVYSGMQQVEAPVKPATTSPPPSQATVRAPMTTATTPTASSPTSGPSSGRPKLPFR